MAAEIQVTNDVQVAPIYDPDLHPSGQNPVFSNQSAVDVFLDTDPNLLNASPYGSIPISGVKLAAGTGQQIVIASRKLYARAQQRTTIFVLSLLLACFLGLPKISWGQSSNRADCYVTGVATTTGEQISPGYDNRAQSFAIVPCTAWHLVYYASQAATVGIQIMYAPDLGGALGPGSFTAAVPVSGPTPLTSVTGAGHTSYTFSPWINVNVTALTGAGAAIHWQLLGWRPGPSNDVAAPANSIIGSPGNVGFTTGIDPCQSSGIAKSATVGAAIISASTSQIIAAPAAGHTIFICGFAISFNAASGGTPATTQQQVSLEYGTGANCASVSGSAFATIGAQGSTNSTYAPFFPGMTIGTPFVANEVCDLAQGTGVDALLTVLYVVQ